jgi:cellulose synthase (UDP-forming)
LNIPLIGGLATSTIAGHIGQRIRWARGMVQILRLENPLLGRGLTLPQRLCYFNCMIHFLYALPRLIFLTSPLVYLLLDRNNVYGYIFAILAYTFPHLTLAILTNSRVHGRFRHSFWNEVYETVLSPFILLPTLAALLNPKWGRFNVTPKGETVQRSYLDWRVAAPFVILLGLNLAGAVVGIRRLVTGTEVFGTVAANILWTIINSIILGAAVAACYERRQLRAANRVDTVRPARLLLGDGRSLPAETRNLSLGGAALACGEPGVLRRGDSIRIAMDEAESETAYPALVVEHRSPIVRVAFEKLTLRQQDALTRQLFGRADTWLRWNEGCELDRPLRSFFRISRLSILGFLTVVAQPFLLFRAWGAGTTVSGRRRFATPMLLLLVAALLLAWRAAAQPSSKDAPLPVFHDTIELGRSGQRESMVLRGLSGQSSAQFSIALTKVALRAKLLLQYTPSPRLEAGSSTLAISLNGSPVATAPLQHSSRSGARVETEVELPGDLLMNENTISFALSGKCPACSAATAADLRTWIEPSSVIEVTGNVLPSPNDTKLLPSPFFDPAQRQSLNISFFFTSPPGKDVLAAAAVVSSWFGSMADARTLQFGVAVGHFPAGNVVAFIQPGTETAGRLGLDGKAGPAIALRDNPVDPSGKVLAVLGATAEQMRTAATALVVNALPAHGDYVPIPQPATPAPRQAYDAPRWAATDRTIRLVPEKPRDEHSAYGDGTVRVYFRLPPDLHFGTRTSVPLGVTFRYSELRGRSALAQVRMNGLLVGSIRVKAGQEDEPVSRVLPVPVSALYPRNTLSIEFSTQSGGEIVPRATLTAGTWLDVRDVPHFTRLPRLDLFAKAGFPFTRMADLSDTAIVIPDRPSAAEIGLLLELTAFLAEQTGYPGLRLTVTHGGDAGKLADKDLLVIGRNVGEAPLSAWADSMPLLLDRNTFQLPAHRSLLDRLSAQRWTAEGRARRELARQLQRDDQPDAAIVGFASPLSAGRSIVAIAALKPEAMQSIVESLNRSTAEDHYESSVLLHVNGELRAYAVAAPTTHSGRLSWVGGFNYWTHRYLVAVPFVVFAGMFIVAAVLRRQLEERARRRLELT